MNFFFLLTYSAFASELLFVFEVTRHGARAPYEDFKTEEFKVGKGMLTASGMRQTYLRGRYARARYVDEYRLLSPQFDASEVFFQSTDKERTIQSAYADLLGLYAPGKAGVINSKMKIDVPFKVRHSDVINANLGDAALPHNYTADYVVNFGNNQDILGDI